MGRPDDLVFLFCSINGDMVFHDFFDGRMVFQLPVNLVRQLLPAVFSKDLRQFFFTQLVPLLPNRQSLQHLVQLALRPLGTGIGDFLCFRLVNLVLGLRFFRFRLGLIEHAKLPGKLLQLLGLPTEALGLHGSKLLPEKGVLLL